MRNHPWKMCVYLICHKYIERAKLDNLGKVSSWVLVKKEIIEIKWVCKFNTTPAQVIQLGVAARIIFDQKGTWILGVLRGSTCPRVSWRTDGTCRGLARPVLKPTILLEGRQQISVGFATVCLATSKRYRCMRRTTGLLSPTYSR